MAKSKTQAFSRPPWERMMRFHHLIKEKSYPNCNQVAKEFEVSWRAIIHATVVRPQALANRLREIGKALHSRYQP